jgi:hypothetical protein
VRATLDRIALGLVVAVRFAAGPLVVPDLDGKSLDLLAGDGLRATVLVFLGVDCPISNRYAPELERLAHDFAARGVRFYQVYPEPSLDAAAVRRHADEYTLTFPALLDSAHRLVETTGVEVTPEAAVLAPDGAVLYRGRIDDRWLDFDQRRPRATRHDLREALDAIVAGSPLPAPSGRAVGCYIEPLAKTE